jgi:hypothetical protein
MAGTERRDLRFAHIWNPSLLKMKFAPYTNKRNAIGLSKLWGLMRPQNPTPRQKRRLWIWVPVLVTYAVLLIYIWTVLTRIAGK